MSLKKMTSILCVLTISLLVFAACENPDDPNVPTPIVVSGVDDIWAGQTGDNAITVMWNASKSEDSTWFVGYELTISTTGVEDVVIPTSTIVKNHDYTCTALDITKTYTFKIVAVGKDPNDTTVNKKSGVKEINWALANHFTKNYNESEIRIYGSKSNYGSGLQFYDSDKFPSGRTINDSTDWNLGLHTGDGKILFGSASQLGYKNSNNTARTFINSALISDIEPVTSSEDAGNTDVLTGLLHPGSLESKNYTEKSIDLTTYQNDPNITKGIVFYAKTKDNHYAKIVILKKNGKFLQDAGTNNEYIQVYISYQTRVNVPYAKTSN